MRFLYIFPSQNGKDTKIVKMDVFLLYTYKSVRNNIGASLKKSKILRKIGLMKVFLFFVVLDSVFSLIF